MSQIRVLLADDHAIIRAGIKLLLEKHADVRVVGEVSDGREALAAAEQHHPDVVVMDLTMPNLNGIEATRQILAAHPQAAVVVLSMHSDEAYVLRALKAGARGYVLKDSTETDLITAVKAVTSGKSFFSPAVSRLLVEDYTRQLQGRNLEDSYDLLTAREREILQLAAEGKSNKEIANLLNLSVFTVETHRKNIMEKLNLHGVPELILYAVRKGVVS
jgi:two-component system, NarL family, response regulator NreC